MRSIIIFIAFILICGLILIVVFNKSETKPEVNTKEKPIKAGNLITEDKKNLKEQLTENVKDIFNEKKSIVDWYINRPEDVDYSLEVFKKYWDILSIAKDSLGNKEIKKLRENLHTILASWQANSFPKIRKKYAEFVNEKVWEVDLDATVSGSSNTILNLTGYHFAANRNIKTTMDALNSSVIKLRFKKIIFRWSEYSNKYTYYNLDTPADNEIIN